MNKKKWGWDQGKLEQKIDRLFREGQMGQLTMEKILEHLKEDFMIALESAQESIAWIEKMQKEWKEGKTKTGHA